MIRHSLAVLATAVCLSLAPVALAGDHSHDGHAHAGHAPAEPAAAEDAAAPDPEAIVAAQLPTYPLETCVVSGEELGSMGDPVDHVHEGRLVRFCCGMCEEQFARDPEKYLAAVDEAVIAAQLPTYPLETCPISGMKLGGMGEPYDHVHGTRLVRFCCAGCLPKFAEDPDAALARIDAARAEKGEAEE